MRTSEASIKPELARLKKEQRDKESEHQKWQADMRAQEREAERQHLKDEHWQGMELKDKEALEKERQYNLDMMAKHGQIQQSLVTPFIQAPKMS